MYRGSVAAAAARQPIKGAEISVLGRADIGVQTSNEQGSFSFELPTVDGKFQGALRVRHPDYDVAEKDIELQADTTGEPFMLATKPLPEHEWSGLDKSFVTTSGGEYRIPIARDLIGTTINLQLTKPGWQVVDRRQLMCFVKRDQLNSPHRIVMRRITAGAPRKPASITARPNPETVEIRQLMDTATLLEGRGLNEASLQKYEEAITAIRKAKARPQKEEMECLTRMSWL